MSPHRSERPGRPRGVARRACAPCVERVEARRLLATFTVLGTGNAGPGTLRQAILDANASPGQDTIAFNIAGSGPFSIAPTTDLPTITDPAILDATTQSGFAGSPVVELNGSLVSGSFPNTRNGLNITAPNTTVRGLAINRFGGYGIAVSGAAGGTIAGNFLGTDPTGAIALGNTSGGVILSNATNFAIGGRAAADRNVISGNRGPGVLIPFAGGSSAGNAILGNLIGTDATGTRTLSNLGDGISIDTSGTQVGGPAPGEANTIAFNTGAGVRVGFFNTESGVTSNPIRGNAIFANGALGIDLGNPGVTFGGSFGTGFGPNRLQAFPVITSAFPSGTGTAIEGQLSSTPNSTFFVDFYANDAADPSGFGEGQRYLGTATVTTGPNGVATLQTTLAAGVPAGQFLTATATDQDGNTSEFSAATSVTPTALADLAVAIAATPDPVLVGGELTYSIFVTNRGPSRATNVTLTDLLPSGATFVTAAPSRGTFSVGGGNLVAIFGDLRSGEGASIQVVVRPTAEGTLANTATVRADQSDPEPGDDSATANTRVDPATPADLSVFTLVSSPQVAVGQDLTYTLIVANNGPSGLAAGVVLTDLLPSGATYVSSSASQGAVSVADGSLTADLGALPLGGNATIRITVRPTTPGILTNTASVRGDQGDPNSLNNTSTTQTLATIVSADLSISAIALPDPVAVGRPLTYTITVTNNGPGNATGATILDELDPGLTFVSATSSQGTVSASGGVVTASLGTLVAGQSAQVTIVVQPTVPGTFSSTATARADQPDFNPANNSVTTTSQAFQPTNPPTILSQRLIVTRKGITGVVLTFSAPMDPTQAESPNNYRILRSGPNGLPESATGPSVAIASAAYNPLRRSVTLTLARPLALGQFYQVTANGVGASGLVDTAGNVLDGDRNGLPDGIYRSLIGRGTKSRPLPLQRDQLVPIPGQGKNKTGQATPGHRRKPITPVKTDLSVNLSFAKHLSRTIG